jgi:3-hydroxyisobutyrate dehydrogenase-like beta-hydroxyacid dehydrogenase
MSDLDIGVIGLGLMGSSIATRLHETGHDVTGFDVSDEALESIAEVGVDTADSAASVAASVDVVITSLPTPDVVEDAYLGDAGIDEGAANNDGLVAIEMSTIDPDTTRSIDDGGDNFELVDAPVSGGPENCDDGTLMIIAGGTESTYESETVQTVLECLGSKVFYAGDVGSGHTVKLLNNVMSMGNLLLSMEIVSLGVAAGVDGDVLHEILPNTGGASNQFRKRFPRVLNRNFEPGFTVDYAKKDIGLAMETAESEEVPMFMGEMVYQMYTRAMAEGLGEEDCCSVVKLFEQSTGVPVEADAEIDETFEGYS